MGKTEAQLLVEQEISRHGPISFRTFMDWALYHPHYGYYSGTMSPRGREGDYFTSLQVSPLFSDVFAEAVLKLKETLNAAQFSIVEVGSGGGEFLERVLTALHQQKQEKGIWIWSVEKSPVAREKIRRRLSRFPRCTVVSSFEELDPSLVCEGLIFSNELFDALPFHRLRFTEAGWKEIFIDFADGRLGETERDLSDLQLLENLKDGSLEFVAGQEIEVRPQIPMVYQRFSEFLARGYVLTVDYGYSRRELYDPQRLKGTWMCYKDHKAHTNIFENIGKQDITAHVDFSQLYEAGGKEEFDPLLYASQGIFLAHAGAQLIQKFLTEAGSPQEQARNASAVNQLLHPSSMGEAFRVLLQGKRAEIPKAWKDMPNRLTRLVPPKLASA